MVRTRQQATHEDVWVSALRIQDWDCDPPKKLVLLSLLKGCLRKGEDLPGNVCEIWRQRDVEEVQMLWQSFDNPAPLTLLLLGEAQKAEGITFTRLTVSRGQWGPKIEHVALLSVGSNKSPWTPKSTVVPTDQIAKIERVSVRVSAPKDFRQAFLPDHIHEDGIPAIVQSLAHLSSGSVTDFFGGKWNKENKGQAEQVVGFLKIKPSLAKNLVDGSGRRGLFISNVGGPRVQGSPPFWIARESGEGDDSYFQKALQLSQSRKQPLIFRLGKGQTLGFLRKPDDPFSNSKKLMCIHGIPASWHLDEVDMVLSSLKWAPVENLNRKGRVWFFMGTPPKAPRVVLIGGMTWGRTIKIRTGMWKFKLSQRRPKRRLCSLCESPTLVPSEGSLVILWVKALRSRQQGRNELVTPKKPKKMRVRQVILPMVLQICRGLEMLRDLPDARAKRLVRAITLWPLPLSWTPLLARMHEIQPQRNRRLRPLKVFIPQVTLMMLSVRGGSCWTLGEKVLLLSLLFLFHL